MATSDTGDILMMLVGTNGGPIAAECQTKIDASSDLMLKGFSNGCFFEISNFEFGIKVIDSDDTSDRDDRDEGKGEKGTSKKKKKEKSKYQAWVSGTAGAAAGYPIELEEIKFDRQMDRASISILNYCIGKTPFKKAVIVKRKDAGNGTGPGGFLRIDFENVLFTGIDLDDGEVVKEKCSFVCRSAIVQYAQQQSDGTFGAAKSAQWISTTSKVNDE